MFLFNLVYNRRITYSLENMEIGTQTLKDQFELKELELNSLLEITQAINDNLAEDSLYKIYNFTLRANLNIKKLALYVLDDDWECKVNFGTVKNFGRVPLHESFLDYTKISHLGSIESDSPFLEFDFIIPVMHKSKVLAFVLVGGFNSNDGIAADTNTNFIQALTNIIIVAIENKKLARQQLRQEGFRKELEIARDVQQFLFPKNLPNTPELQIEASYLPHHEVSGDYYDYIPIDEDQFLLCIADVSGKGMPAAILMSNFQASLRTLARQTNNLKKIINELNYQILQSANGENFITFFVAIYNKKTRKFHYVNAGHNPPILCMDETRLQLLEKGTTILGTFYPLPFLNVGLIENMERFFFFSYTDGVTETVNAEDKEFSQSRLKSFLREHAASDLKTIHNRLLEQLNQYKGDGEYKDDITLLSCRFNAYSC